MNQHWIAYDYRRRGRLRTHRSVFGLRNEEVDGDGLKGTPDDEDDIRLPANPFQ